MNRRAFIALLGGAATSSASWPLAARAQQQPERMRRVGVLMNVGADDPNGQNQVATFIRNLERFNWTVGRNVQIEVRWTAGDTALFRKYAADLVALEPDVILAVSTPAVMPLRQLTRKIPIVFVTVVDPLGSGVVASLARPGGNATGFTLFEYSIGAKWLELLKEIAPHVTRAGVMRDSATAAGIGQFATIQTMTATTGMDLTAIDVHDPGEIESAVAKFAESSSVGLIITPNPFSVNHPDVITRLAAKYKLPAVYPFRYFINAGGLICYGPVVIDQYRRAAGYVDRILKGEKPSNLPVQTPVKFELLINLKVGKTLGLTVPPSLLARADEVIE